MKQLLVNLCCNVLMEQKGTCNHAIIMRRGEFVCDVYGLSYCVAGTTNATPMESNDGFLKV